MVVNSMYELCTVGSYDMKLSSCRAVLMSSPSPTFYKVPQIRNTLEQIFCFQGTQQGILHTYSHNYMKLL